MAGVVFGLVALLLWPLFILFLNPRFDPDWKHRRWTAFETEALPLFAVFRLSLYVPAVCSDLCARRLFGQVDGASYDFRGRAGPVLYTLCMIEMLSIAGAVAGAIAHNVIKALA